MPECRRKSVDKKLVISIVLNYRSGSVAPCPVTEYGPKAGAGPGGAVQPEGSWHVLPQLDTGNATWDPVAVLCERKIKDHRHLVAGYHHNLTPK